MKFRIEQMTPTKAANILKKNDGNRAIRTKMVKGLIHALKNNEWMLTHQPVAIDKNGRLIDGQHRLYAIIQAGLPNPVPTVLATECNPETFKCIDIGAKRSIRDILGGNRLTVETITRIARIGEATNSPSPQTVEKYAAVFSEACEEVTEKTHTIRALITSAPMRASIAVHMMTDPEGSGEYALKFYEAMSQAKYEALPVIGRLALTKFLERKYSANTNEFLALCWLITNKENSEKKFVHTKYPATAVDDLRSKIRDIMKSYEV